MSPWKKFGSVPLWLIAPLAVILATSKLLPDIMLSTLILEAVTSPNVAIASVLWLMVPSTVNIYSWLPPTIAGVSVPIVTWPTLASRAVS